MDSLIDVNKQSGTTHESRSTPDARRSTPRPRTVAIARQARAKMRRPAPSSTEHRANTVAVPVLFRSRTAARSPPRRRVSPPVPAGSCTRVHTRSRFRSDWARAHDLL